MSSIASNLNFKSVINKIFTNKVPTASIMGKMMIPQTANLLGRGEPDNPITTHSVQFLWKSSASPGDDQTSTSVLPPLHDSRDQLRHSAGGRRCGGVGWDSLRSLLQQT